MCKVYFGIGIAQWSRNLKKFAMNSQEINSQNLLNFT